MRKILYVLPRLSGVAAILFISMFALDSFQGGVPFAQMMTGLFMHLVPALVLTLILAFAWKYEMAGGFAFIIIAGVPFVLLSNDVWVNAMLAGPFLLTGVLFILNGVLHKN